MLLRLVFFLCLALGGLSEVNQTSTISVNEPFAKLKQASLNSTTDVVSELIKKKDLFKPAALSSTEQNPKQVTFKSITRDYYNASIRLQKEFNTTAHRLLNNYPIQKFPNHQDDGWVVYIPHYYIGRYIYLKVNYVQAIKDYKQEITDFGVDAEKKLKTELRKAQDSIKNLVHSSSPSTELKEREEKSRDEITKYDADTLNWLHDIIDRLWENYNEIFLPNAKDWIVQKDPSQNVQRKKKRAP